MRDHLLAQEKKDSLETGLKTLKDDSVKVNLLTRLSFNYLYTDTLKASLYAQEGLMLAEKINFKRGIANATACQGNINLVRGNYDKAIELHSRVLKMREQMGNKLDLGHSYMSFGNIYYMYGDSAKSFFYFKNALKAYEECNSENDISDALNNLGAVYNLTGNNKKALDYYLRALKIEEKSSLKANIMNTLNNIGNTYKYMNDYAHALEFLFRSLNVSREGNDLRAIAMAYGNIASAYGDSRRIDSAIIYSQEALKFAEQVGAKDILRTGYKTLSESYAFKHDTAKAYLYHLKYTNISEQLLNEEKTRQLYETEAKYQNEKKNIEIEILNEKSEKNRVTAYLLVIGLLFAVLLAVMIFNRSRLKQRSSKVIEEKNKELERLAIVASETENIILVMEPDGTLEWVNESFVRLNGITLPELKKLKGETIYGISNNPNIKNIVQESIKTRKPVVYESLNKTSSGKLVWESSTLTPIFDNQGKLKKLIIIDTDITVRKLAEEIIEEKNKDITDSIHYAQRIQKAILAGDTLLNENLPEHFVLFKPKDIVSGDFYWASAVNDIQGDKQNFYLAVADSTGHGVPGAFMSLLNISYLNEAITERHLEEPNKILDHVRNRLIESLRTDGSEEGGKDGMDCILLRFNKHNLTIEAACANNSLVVLRNDEIIEYKADHMPVGKFEGTTQPFTLHQIQLQKGDCVYAFTDGYPDQFGGPKGKKFKYKALNEALKANADKSMKKQKEILETLFISWKGELEQVDDVLIVGIRI